MRKSLKLLNTDPGFYFKENYKAYTASIDKSI